MCKDCGHQFVVDNTKKVINQAQKGISNKLLLEKISLAGISRVVEVSQVWLGDYISDLYASQPDDLHAQVPTKEAMQAHLEDRFDEHIYRIEALKKTLHRLSLRLHGKILRHLTTS
ncbi:hypothetical protein [Rufibacter sp. XAAS-G3-1]|uniref:hypothetical protein n=1 Tax=Rufibacter sp. XAAS-G3-1 TaxID=2729134 RepID=UPI0015E71B2A|nr:hypothetical protein [Rufibacter sp. XAAS-G3-1]